MPKLTPSRPTDRQTGFTLIELLIVIVIIAILTALLAVSYTTIQRNARDSQRKSDLATVAGILERYYSEHSAYPSSNAGKIDCSGTGLVWGTDGVVCGGKNYIKQLPSDPIEATTTQYCYVAQNSNQRYELYANMEGKGNISSTSCNLVGGYDYRVTSNN